MKYLLVAHILTSAGKEAVHPITDTKEEAEALIAGFLSRKQLGQQMVKFYVLSGPDSHALNESYQNLVSGKPASYHMVSPEETRRFQLEDGEGGDHDKPYERTTPTQLNEIASLGRLIAKVHRGELGGANDGD